MDAGPDVAPPEGARTALRRLALAIAAATVAVVATVVVLLSRGGPASRPSSAAPSPAALPGALTAPAPWPANTEELRARLDAIGLPALGAEGDALHLHVVVAIVIDGRPVPIAAGIGMDPDGRFIAPIHTHDSSGTIHVESEDVRTFRLGEVFGVWGVPMDERCLGPYCAGPSATLRFTVDGEPVVGDPRAVELRDGQTVGIEYAAG